MEELILSERIENIQVLKINRPKVFNALNRETVDLFDKKIEEIRKDREIRVLIVTGDHHFAAGADISDMIEKTPEEAKEFLFTNTFSKLENLEIPTIAAICGYALGGGLELALTCDLRIASEDAKLGLPEINLGIMPGAGGTVRLPRLIGEAKAKEMIYLGSRLTASEAYQYGIINKIVKKEELMKEAVMMARSLAEKAPLALRAAKEAILYSECRNKSEALHKESEIWSGLFATQDQKEGMRAFLEKRAPQYQSK